MQKIEEFEVQMNIITLESLVYNDTDVQRESELVDIDYTSMELGELIFECAELNNTLCVYEAAKCVKEMTDNRSEIVTIENGIADTFSKLRDKVKELWDKFIEFVKSVMEKLTRLFDFEERFIIKNESAIKAGLDKLQTIPIELPTIVASYGLKRCAVDIHYVLQSWINNVEQEIQKGYAEEDYEHSRINDIESELDEYTTKLETSITPNIATFSILLKFFGDGKIAFVKVIKSAKDLANFAKTEAIKSASNSDEDRIKAIQRAAHVAQVVIAVNYKKFLILQQIATLIARKASKLGQSI